MSVKINPVIHAVTLNWNRFDDTVECVESLKKSSYPLKKIIIIDQASEDGSGKKLKQKYNSDENIVFIQNDENLGFSRGMNIGIRETIELGADYVFIINNDAIVDQHCIKLLYEALIKDPFGAVAGPVILYYSKPDKIWQAGGYFNLKKMGVTVPDKGKLLTGLDLTPKSVSFLTGCALLFSSEMFNKIGYFDSTYFFYSEDVDLGLRIKAAGLNMHFIPEAKAWHKIEDITIDRTTPKVLYNLGRSSIIMLRKNFSGIKKYYGIFLRFSIYTFFRMYQIFKGKRGWDSILAWIKGLIDGSRVKLK